MYNLGHLGLYKNIPKKRMFNPTPDYERDSYTLLQYKSHLRNEFLIPLKANGDGTGVATIRLQSLEEQSVKITGNGRFYTDASGTTEAGIESTIGTSLTSLYVKVPACDSCYLVCKKADKLTGLGDRNNSLTTQATNAPIINGCTIAYKLASLLYIRLTDAVKSFLLGSIDNTPSLTYLNLYNNPLSVLMGSIDSTPNLTLIIMANNPLSALTVDIGLSVKCNFFNFENNTASRITYSTPRNTIDKWPSGQFRYIYVSKDSMTTAMVDQLLIDVDSSGVVPVTEKKINLAGLCGAVTSASAAAIASLVSKGFTVVVNT